MYLCVSHNFLKVHVSMIKLKAYVIFCENVAVISGVLTLWYHFQSNEDNIIHTNKFVLIMNVIYIKTIYHVTWRTYTSLPKLHQSRYTQEFWRVLNTKQTPDGVVFADLFKHNFEFWTISRFPDPRHLSQFTTMGKVFD